MTEIRLHLYVDEHELREFHLGETETLNAFSKEVKNETHTIHIDIPLGVTEFMDYGSYTIYRSTFEGGL